MNQRLVLILAVTRRIAKILHIKYLEFWLTMLSSVLSAIAELFSNCSFRLSLLLPTAAYCLMSRFNFLTLYPSDSTSFSSVSVSSESTS